MAERGKSRFLLAVAGFRPGRWKPLLYVALAVLTAVVTSAPSRPIPAHASRPRQERISIEGDARLFVQLAREPALMLEPGNVRQSRPLYILVAAALRTPIAAALDALGIDAGHADGWLPEYCAYVLMNVALLGLALIAFDHLFCGATKWSWDVAVMSLFLVTNVVSSTYLWSPHTQLCNVVLIPLLLLTAKTVAYTDKLRWRYTVAGGLGLGFLLLFYGSFVTMLPVVWFALIVREAHATDGPNRDRRLRRRRAAAQGAVFSLLACLPTLLWIGLLSVVAGSYYNEEVTEYRQFVWVLDSLQAGGWPQLILHEVPRTVSAFVLALSSSAQGHLVPLLGLGLAAAVLRTRRRCELADRQVRLSLMIVAVPVILFFYLQNFYRPRLLWNVTMVLVVFNTVLLRDVSRLAPRWFAVFLRVGLAAAALAGLES